MNESLIRKGINGINQVAESIAGAEYWSKVAPGMKQLQQEVGERIAKNSNKPNAELFSQDKIETAANFVAKTLRKVQGKEISGIDFDEDVQYFAEKIKSATDIDAIFEKNKHLFGDEDWNKFADVAKKKLGQPEVTPRSPKDAYDQSSILTRLVETPKAYFTNPDKDVRKARITAAAGGYAAVAVGGRYLSGGTLTRDSYGRNDIAGVPFI